MEDFRICPTTGLKVHKPAELLIQVNAVTGIVFLLIGGLAALLLALTKIPAVHLLPSDLFYRFLTLHGIAMLVAWIIFFEAAILYFASAVLLNCRLATVWLAWVAYGLMLGGALLAAVQILIGNADVMFTSYPPLQAHHLYYLGVILFAVGAILVCCVFFGTLAVAKHEKTHEGSLPLVTFGAAAAAIIAIITLAHGAIIYIPTWLWALGVVEHIDAPTYRLIFWGFGHSSQQINVCAMIAVWYLLAAVTVGAKPLNQRVCRTAFVLYILFIDIASEHHILVDPGFGAAHKAWNTGYFMHLAVLASMIHALAVPASVEVALRKKGHTQGLFEWLKMAPWGNPAFSALAWSVVGFGFVGGITGVTFGTEQINIIAHNTWRITGHFHGTVVAGTTIAFMGLTYVVLPLIFRRELAFPALARIQPHLFGLGVVTFAIAMMLTGAYGMPRRHWDYTFADTILPVALDPSVMVPLNIFGLGAILAVVGGGLFILVAVGTLLFGKKIQ